jgi:arabinose-5-phosphate isomerase
MGQASFAALSFMDLASFLLGQFVYTAAMSVTDEKTMQKAFDNSALRRAMELARETLTIEADAIAALNARLETDDSVAQAVQLLLNCSGRVVVSGIGKSGHIGRKIAATLASTGTPAMFVHPAEAAHGDLGMVTAHDAFIAISNSGEASELLSIVGIIKRMGAPLISMTGNPNSSLGRLADVHLDVSVAKEA